MEFAASKEEKLKTLAAYALHQAIGCYPTRYRVYSDMTAKSLAEYFEELFPYVICMVEDEDVIGVAKMLKVSGPATLSFHFQVMDPPWLLFGPQHPWDPEAE